MENSFFDEIINRSETGSIKHDFYQIHGKPAGVIPLWVADMDFRSPPEVIDALKHHADGGVFGYTYAQPEYFDAQRHWFSSRFGWKPVAKWNQPIPGVMFGVAATIRALTQEGDAVLIQQPVYHPFQEIIVSNRRELVVNELLRDADGRYSVNWDDFEQKIIQRKVKIFLLCSPHNPVARVWTEAELRRMGETCLRHGVQIISDEIHADFPLFGARQILFPTLGEELAENCILCTSPSKTFNLMGLQTANLWVSNAELREKIVAECQRFFWFGISASALVASTAAYRFGEEWLDELRRYLEGNVRYVTDRLDAMRSEIRVTPHEGTYLMWLDCRAWGKTDAELDSFFTHEAGLWLNQGSTFGVGGSGFMRLNIASSRKILTRAMNQLEAALQKRR